MSSTTVTKSRTSFLETSPWVTNPVGQLWHTLTSVRLALIVILLLTAGLLAGTMINQVSASVAADRASYNQWIADARERYGVFTPLMERLQLFNVYGSFWFRGLIAVLVANIVVCTVNRWGSLRAAVFRPRVRMTPAYFERAHVRAAYDVGVDVPAAASAVQRGLRKSGFRTVTEDGESVAMYADRFRLSRLGTLFTHLSLVLVLVGAMMGRVFGWKDDAFILATGATRNVPLAQNISVKLEQFQEQWYVEGPPKDFASDIVVYDNGKEVRRGTVRVNEPLSYKGIDFNQAFYGQVAEIEVTDTAGKQLFNEGVPLAWTSKEGKRPIGSFEVPGQNVKAYVVGPEPGQYDALVQLGTMRLELYDSSTSRLTKIETLQRNRDVKANGLTYRFLRESQFTGLKVVKDPGVTVVWIASGLMVAGLVLVFWFPHRRMWALISPREDGGADVRLAAAAQRDLGLEKAFDQVTTNVRREISRVQRASEGGKADV